MRKLAFAVLVASPVEAEVVTTDEIQAAMKHLGEEASCRDVLRTIAINDNPLTPSTSEYLSMLMIKNFLQGYAFAKGQSLPEAFQETIARCTESLEAPFSEFQER